MKITLDINPAMLPTQVLLGLTLGRILLFPNLIPNQKAAVSHIQTDRKSAKVIENPMAGTFLNVERDPSIIPSQIKAKIKLLIFIRGVCLFRKISIVMADRVKPINRIYIGIFHIITGCLSICSMAININRRGRNGWPFKPLTKMGISLIPRNNTMPTKTLRATNKPSTFWRG